MLLGLQSFKIMPCIFSLSILETPTQKYSLLPPSILFYCFELLFNFEASSFIQIYFKLGNYFVTRPDFIKGLECPWYILSILIWEFFSVPKVSFKSQLNLLLRILLKVAFMGVLPLFIYLSFWFDLQWSWSSSSPSSSQKNSRSR